MIRACGRQLYVFATIDDDTRYCLAHEVADTKHQHRADTLFQMTRDTMGKAPANLITDGLHTYKKAARRVFGKDTSHIADVGIRSRRPGRTGRITGQTFHRNNNNKMERFNGMIRDREVAFRGLKRKDTALLPGLMVHYNYVKRHGGLGGNTPAAAAGIEVSGANKWLTLIQNAALDPARI